MVAHTPAREPYPLYAVPPEQFPGSLTEIPDTPSELTARGTLPPAEHTLLTVVGSRRYSTYGKQAVERLVGGLRGYPVTIVSGLALGIDALAHRAALAAGLHTLAVPGSGLGDAVLYPRQHRALAHEILRAGGGLVSEFASDFRAAPWSFLKRNRIMAGISRATLVVEATEKSGTLVTARLATDYNRDVLTVPGSIFSANSAGPHLLLRLGATPVTTSAEVLDALDLEPLVPGTDASTASLSDEEAALLAALAEPCTRDELVRRLACPQDELNARIMLLALRGYLSETNGTLTRLR